jgi:hypothetical protein
MEGLTMALSNTSLKSDSSHTSNSTIDGNNKAATPDSSISDSASVYDLTFTEDFSIISSDFLPFNDRSMETRDARLASALYSLDEDLPQDIDESIKILLRVHANSTPSAFGHVEFLADDNYLEYKSTLAAKRALEKELPKCKSRATKGLTNHTNSTPTTLGPFRFLVHEDYLQYKSSLAAKRANEMKLPKSKGRHVSP